MGAICGIGFVASLLNYEHFLYTEKINVGIININEEADFFSLLTCSILSSFFTYIIFLFYYDRNSKGIFILLNIKLYLL